MLFFRLSRIKINQENRNMFFFSKQDFFSLVDYKDDDDEDSEKKTY